MLGGKHILSYGGNFRRNNFDITLAPGAEDRNEFGAYVQDEFFFDKFRVAAGRPRRQVRQPRRRGLLAARQRMFKPTPDHSFRVSFNRAFRSPSVINNYLDQNIFEPAVDRPRARSAPLLPAGPAAAVPREPFFLIVNDFGNTDLKEEHIDAFELAYTGTFGGTTTVGLAVYQNDTDDNINFYLLLPDREPRGCRASTLLLGHEPGPGRDRWSRRASRSP